MNNDTKESGSVLDDLMETADNENYDIDDDEEGGIRIDEDIYIPPPPKLSSSYESDNTDNGTIPRLIITKIINTNFKSYAGDVQIGPFNKCFSSIVGPNGSGKSNVIDAMLFVFGYRATKIRSKKVSALIHNSNEHPNITSCTVAVYFEKIIDTKDEEHETVPDSQFVISRTAFKDSSSYYELNGKRVQFKEIGKLLRNEGIDLDHNRFLILQGEVEQIAMMKPKGQNGQDMGMLEFLEDIIGTTRYKIPLEQTMERIELLSEKYTEKLVRLKIIEKERDTLREPMEEAVNYLKMENVITNLQHKIYHCKKSKISAELIENEIIHNKLDNEFKSLKNELENVEKEKENVNHGIKEKNKKWNSIQVSRDEVSGKFDDIKKTDEALHAELVETNKRRKANKTAVVTERGKLEELLQVPHKNKQEIEECEKVIQRHTANRLKEETKLNELMESLKEQTEPLIKKRSDLETKLITHRKKVNDAKAKFDLAKSELQIYTTVEETEKKKLNNIKETIEITEKTLKDRKNQLDAYKTKIPATKKSLDEAQNELHEIKQREIEYTDKLKNMRLNFEEKKSSFNANKSRNSVIDALMTAKKNGEFPGIFGRLGDLGAIDAKYDIAVSTACGALDNIVVDTVETAQNCIQFLRDNNIGRATFLPLEKQQRFLSHCSEKIETPENSLRLFDLIKVKDKKVLPAFYYGLRDTLVVDDLNQATKIAYGKKRYRVATLKGDLIEIAGTMSGGGKSVCRGKMGRAVVRRESLSVDIEKLEKELDTIFEECNCLRNKQQPLQDQINTLSTALKEMMLNKDKFEIEIKTLTMQLPSLKSQLKDQEKKVANSISSPERVQELTLIVNEAEKNLKKIQQQSESIEQQVIEINNAIEKVSGGKVKEQQIKITKLGKSIDTVKSGICQLQVAIKNANRTYKKTEEKISTLENDISSCEQRITVIQKEKLNLEAEAKLILEEMKKFDEILAERDEVVINLKSKCDEIIKRELKLRNQNIDIDEKLSSSKKIITGLSQKINEYTRKIQKLKLNQIPDEPNQELVDLVEDEILTLNLENLLSKLGSFEKKLSKEIPNMKLIEEYLEKDAIFKGRSLEVEQINEAKNKMRSAYDIARKSRLDEFYAGFSVITTRLKEMYQMITLGGTAELELVDSLDPFTEGITFSVRPPKKSWKNISNLSGGEKTLSSLALVFALHHYKPTPLYFMDEIDAALDFKNVSIVGRYIKDRTKNAQFIIISLRAEMFELADTLIGIYKTFNSTKCASVIMKSLCKLYEDNEKDDVAKRLIRGRKLTSSH